ncbi:MAG: LpqB family beta-propeller domain-containing protein [Sporichthyaceae bacterium]
MTDRRPVAVAVALVAVLLGGCASLPTSGPVRAGRDLQAEPDNVGVRVIGQPPVPGSRPQDIVRGFLQASADFVNDHAVARLYLAPAARQRWKPGTGTAVYDRSVGPFSVEPTSAGSVGLTATEVASIDRQGHYRRTQAGTRLTRSFPMTRVDGQWRIASLANGLVLTKSDVQETFRQLNLYFLAPSRRVLVPDTLFLPAAPGLSTALITRLLAGPTENLAAATTTAFPRGSSLAVSSVPVRDGIAQVNLDASVLKADGATRSLMSAQLVWTLKQLPEFQGLKLMVEGDDLSVPDQGQVQSQDAWNSYDPAGLAQGADAFVIRAGRLGRIGEGRFTPVPGPAGIGQPALRRPAISLDGARAAAITADGRALMTGRMAEGEAFVERLRGSQLSTPSWDAAGNVWVVDAPVGRVWMIPEGTRAPVAVNVPNVPAGRVTGLRVAHDGVRVAVVAGAGAQARLYVGSIVRGPVGRPAPGVKGLTEILPQLRSVRGVGWADATTLAVLGAQSGGLVAPLFTDTDGYEVAPIEPETGLVSVAAAPRPRPLFAGTGTGRIAQYTAGRGWVDLGPGADPAYPG